ncbi:hypothetical protein SAMN05216298_1419 [Glycomyces sambucus]|uniref:Copper(I)-binding protein n=1 Tax=Glycomyces sambucus TaxID=380244 RepID=A0A1G9EV78_9ACTN|nr:hypothetical protein [Glycomyces sambucus]SDK80082.1 hypothetical protein SAMN05216298_1419 [Glycomyces sambucus]
MERRDARAGRRAAAGLVGAAALALALTGCGAGQHAETSRTQPAISGVDADAGDLVLRDLQIDFGANGSYPEGGQAPLRVWIGNKGETAVVLESVTSPDAAAVVLAAEIVMEEAPESPAGAETPSGDAAETPTGEATASPGDDASETPAGEDEEAVAEIVGEPDFTVEIPAGDFVRLTPTTGSFLLLDGLERDVDMGSGVELVFEFSNGETVEVLVPVGDPGTSGERSYFGDPHEPAAE